MPDDKVLVKEILGGSEAAMEVLTRKYYNVVFAYVYRKLLDRETACDLTQEIFIKIIKNIHAYTGQMAFSTWVYTISLNHCRDYWRSNEYKNKAKQDELTDSISVNYSSVTYIFEAKQSRELVKRTIESLPEYQREVILLKYFHELKIKEIAVITDSSESTVKSRLKQGLAKVAIWLEKEESEYESKRKKP